jgi:hypothetical protein
MICYIVILSALVLILYIVINYNIITEHFSVTDENVTSENVISERKKRVTINNSIEDRSQPMNLGSEDCIFRPTSDPGRFKCDANYYLSGYQTINRTTQMICCKPPPPPFIQSFTAARAPS